MSIVSDNSSLSQNIDTYVKEYLIDTLEPEFYASDFSQKLFTKLLEKLYKEFGEKEVLSRMKILETRVHKHFKANAQESDVQIVETFISVNNKFKNGASTVEMDKALFSLSVMLKTFLQDKDKYALQDHLLCFEKEQLHSLTDKFSSTPIKDNFFSLCDNVRSNVCECFSLNDKDIVLFLRQKLYIRYYVKPRTAEQAEEKRFCGASPEVLEKIYQDNFPNDFLDIILDLAPEVINDALDFSRIDNMAFRAKYIEVFRTLVDIAMQDYISDISKEDIQGLNGYILRMSFDDLLYECAVILISNIIKRDKNATSFLQFYNGETVVDSKGKRINKPNIIDVKNNVWNFSSIFSIMTQYDQHIIKQKKQSQQLQELNENYKQSSQVLAFCKSEMNKSTEDTKNIKRKLTECTNVKNNLKDIKNPSKEKLERLKIAKEEEKVLLIEHDKLYSVQTSASLKAENANIKERGRLKQLDNANKSLKVMEEKGEELYIMKDNIYKALAKAFTFR